ncbi:beta-ureidopropionase [bacterium]|nr:beta-ureidopropionase [bacterium]
MTFRIALVQFNPVRNNVRKNIQRIQKLLRGIHADLIVLPELANTGYLYGSAESLLPMAEKRTGEGPYLSALKDLSQETKGLIVSGYTEKEEDKLYNSAIALSPNGILSNYRKIHLFDNEKALFKPGDSGFNVFEWKGVKIGMMICFDWIFPEAARTLALKGAQIIAHPANLVLPFCQNAMQTRSIENKVFTVTANRTGTEKLASTHLHFTGQSQITNPKGGIIFRGPENKATVHIAEIDPKAALYKAITERNDLIADRRPEYYIN